MVRSHCYLGLLALCGTVLLVGVLLHLFQRVVLLIALI